MTPIVMFVFWMDDPRLRRLEIRLSTEDNWFKTPAMDGRVREVGLGYAATSSGSGGVRNREEGRSAAVEWVGPAPGSGRNAQRAAPAAAAEDRWWRGSRGGNGIYIQVLVLVLWVTVEGGRGGGAGACG